MASTVLTKTPSAGNQLKWTFSTWFKIMPNTSNGYWGQCIFGGNQDTNNYNVLQFDNSGAMDFLNVTGGGVDARLVTNRLFRDTAAWYHVVAVWDSANASAGDRMRLYINGVEETSFSTDTNPSSSLNSIINSANELSVGGYNSGSYFRGNMAHTHFCDGFAYAASDFGETDSTSGIWVAKTSPSVSYGSNGFFFKYQDTSAFGDDSSGNNNDFAVSGTMTQTQDTPDNNFCTMNPLEKNTNNTQNFINGDNTVEITAGYAPIGSTMSVSKGKWYAECHIDSTASSGDLNIMLGINGSYNNPGNNTLGYSASAYGFYLYNGYMLTNNTSNSNTGGTQYWTSPGGGIVDDNKYWALALDCDNNKLYVRLEGTWLESADPSAGTGGYSITAPASTDWGCYRFANGIYFGNTNTFKWNFGNGFFGTTSAGATNADSDGYGVFKYSVPTGFKALCTAQLATYG